MSRYCTGNVSIGTDMCSLVESQDYLNDETIKRTKFTENVKEGDALLLNLRYENGRWILFYVTKVESDSLLYFTPRFSIGAEEITSYDYSFPGQVDDEYQISADGRYCFNSYWYTSRDYTCFFHLPEVRTGDRAWASIFDAAMVRADKLLKSCYREPPSTDYSGGMILRALGTTIPDPDEPVDPGGDDSLAINGLYNTGYTNTSLINFYNKYNEYISSDSIYDYGREIYILNNIFNNIFSAISAIILHMEALDISPMISDVQISLYDVTSNIESISLDHDYSYRYITGFQNVYYKNLFQSGQNFYSDGTPVFNATVEILNEGNMYVKIPQRVYDIDEAIAFAMNTDMYVNDSVFIFNDIGKQAFILSTSDTNQDILRYTSETNPKRYAYMTFYGEDVLWLIRIMWFKQVDTSSITFAPMTLSTNGFYNTGYDETSINEFINNFRVLLEIDYSGQDPSFTSNSDFKNIFVGVAAILRMVELSVFSDMYVSINETNVSIFKNSIKIIDLNGATINFGVEYNGNLNPSYLVPPGYTFSGIMSGSVVNKTTLVSVSVKIPQDYYQLTDAVGRAQNTAGYVPNSMIITSNDKLPYTINTGSAPYSILGHTLSNPYEFRFQTLMFSINDGSIYLVRVQCFDPINTDGP